MVFLNLQNSERSRLPSDGTYLQIKHKNLKNNSFRASTVSDNLSKVCHSFRSRRSSSTYQNYRFPEFLVKEVLKAGSPKGGKMSSHEKQKVFLIFAARHFSATAIRSANYNVGNISASTFFRLVEIRRKTLRTSYFTTLQRR